MSHCSRPPEYRVQSLSPVKKASDRRHGWRGADRSAESRAKGSSRRIRPMDRSCGSVDAAWTRPAWVARADASTERNAGWHSSAVTTICRRDSAGCNSSARRRVISAHPRHAGQDRDPWRSSTIRSGNGLGRWRPAADAPPSSARRSSAAGATWSGGAEATDGVRDKRPDRDDPVGSFGC